MEKAFSKSVIGLNYYYARTISNPGNPDSFVVFRDVYPVRGSAILSMCYRQFRSRKYVTRANMHGMLLIVRLSKVSPSQRQG